MTMANEDYAGSDLADLDAEVERLLDKEPGHTVKAPGGPYTLRGSLTNESIGVAAQLRQVGTALEAIDREVVELGVEFARRLEQIRRRIGVLR